MYCVVVGRPFRVGTIAQNDESSTFLNIDTDARAGKSGLSEAAGARMTAEKISRRLPSQSLSCTFRYVGHRMSYICGIQERMEEIQEVGRSGKHARVAG